MALLLVKDLHVYYEESPILHDISIAVEAGEFIGAIGRNGVGKTTFMKSLIGLLKPRSGLILFKDTQIDSLPPYERSKLGIGYVPQGREIFPELTVLENLKLGLIAKGKGKKSKGSFDLAFNFFPVLGDRLAQKGSTLSGGEQQMLAIARGLLADPELFLLDEPTQGLAPYVVHEIENRLRIMNHDLRVAMILVEQNLELTFRLVNRCYLMEKGEKMTI
jgi:urea transport system ATP-binding protein